MFERLRSLFGVESGRAEAKALDPLALSAAALMLYAAQLDGSIDAAEQKVVEQVLERRFGLSPADLVRLIADAGARAEKATDLYSLTRIIKDTLSEEERIGILEMLWEVVYADGSVTDYETNLVRRVAGLLYVSDVESGAARKRVAERIGCATVGL